MTIEELKELKPTLDNPVELVCDDGFFTSSYYKIKVQGVNNEYVLIEDDKGDHGCLQLVQLHHYPSKKQKTRYYEWYLKGSGGVWYRYEHLVSDDGKLTNDKESYAFKNALDRKRIDDCFIEL